MVELQVDHAEMCAQLRSKDFQNLSSRPEASLPRWGYCNVVKAYHDCEKSYLTNEQDRGIYLFSRCKWIGKACRVAGRLEEYECPPSEAELEAQRIQEIERQRMVVELQVLQAQRISSQVPPQLQPPQLQPPPLQPPQLQPGELQATTLSQQPQQHQLLPQPSTAGVSLAMGQIQLPAAPRLQPNPSLVALATAPLQPNQPSQTIDVQSTPGAVPSQPQPQQSVNDAGSATRAVATGAPANNIPTSGVPAILYGLGLPPPPPLHRPPPPPSYFAPAPPSLPMAPPAPSMPPAPPPVSSTIALAVFLTGVACSVILLRWSMKAFAYGWAMGRGVEPTPRARRRTAVAGTDAENVPLSQEAEDSVSRDALEPEDTHANDTKPRVKALLQSKSGSTMGSPAEVPNERLGLMAAEKESSHTPVATRGRSMSPASTALNFGSSQLQMDSGPELPIQPYSR